MALRVYRETASWPKRELFGLISQCRRAAFSIPANIAEGCGKNSDGELAKHARTSLGSASELAYYLILAHDLEYMQRVAYEGLQTDLAEVRRMLASLERIAAMAAERRSPTARLRRKGTDPAAV